MATLVIDWKNSGQSEKQLAWVEGLKRQEAIRSSGRGTARDRLSLLLDEGSFLEMDTFVTHRTDDHNMFLHQTLGDGVVTGQGTVEGRRVYCFAQDFSVHGGSMGEMHALKIAKVVEMAERAKAPSSPCGTVAVNGHMTASMLWRVPAKCLIDSSSAADEFR